MEGITMYIAKHQTVGAYSIYAGIYERSADTEATKRQIAEALDIPIESVMNRDDIAELFDQYATYPELGPGEKYVTEEEKATLESLVAGLGEHEKLSFDLDVIQDWRGTKYHLKTGDTWAEEEITEIGESLPESAILPENLTPEQRKEIADQKEAERIAALSPEARAKEEIAKLKAEISARDWRVNKATRLKKDLDVLYPGETAWYLETIARINELEDTLELAG
jgi:hypothetical protein